MNNDNTNAGGSFRAKRNPFTQVSNSALRDDNLSLKAKGLYSLIQSYITIPNFTLYKGHLMSVCKEKEKAFDSAWKELKDNGYLKQYRIPKGKNDTFVYEYELLDIADLTIPSLINLNKNGEEIKIDNENSEPKNGNSHTPHLVPYANSTPCQANPMPIAPHAKGGGNNNTDFKKDFKKEDFNNIYIENESDKACQSASYPQQKEIDMSCPAMTDDTTQQNYSEMKKEPSSIKADQSGLKESPFENKQSNSKQYTTYAEWESRIKENIRYGDFIQERQPYIKLIDTIIHNVVIILTETSDYIVLNKKENKQIRTEIAKEICLRLKYDHILYVLNKFKNIVDPVTHKGNYLKSMILSSLEEMEAYYQNEYRQGNL